MDIDTYKKEVAPYRAEILWWEICCLLHDIGKLSDEFLFYRQHWHRMESGWRNRDPHDHDWFKHDSLLTNDLREIFEKDICVTRADQGKTPFDKSKGGETTERIGQLSIKHAIYEHATPNDGLTQILKLADSADARYDRNNPLIGCEQTNHANPDELPDIFRSNVFGYESERTKVERGIFNVDRTNADPFCAALYEKKVHRRPGLLHLVRKGLYGELECLLKEMVKEGDEISLEVYRKVRGSVERNFEPGLSDTTRPDNDTSLWEHVYSVASIAKALHIQCICKKEIPDEARFHLWGIGIDALRYISYGHKVGDLTGRRRVVDQIFDEIERLFEYGLPFGNCVYRDDNFVIFLTPAVNGFEGSLQKQIRGISLEKSAGEIIPQFHIVRDTSTLTSIVKVIEQLRKDIATPVSVGVSEIKSKFDDAWKLPLAGICPVCRLRPAPRRDDGRIVCQICIDRRTGKGEKADNETTTGPKETQFIEEIADHNGRAAMIVVRIGLREWLDGRMVRTCLITEPQGIDRTIKALKWVAEQDLKTDGKGRIDWFKTRGDNDFAKMVQEVAECKSAKGGNPLFLYGRQIVRSKTSDRMALCDELGDKDWDQIIVDGCEEHPWIKTPDDFLACLLCAKTPTPSTVLDVWQTTQEFLKSIVRPVKRWNIQDGEPDFKSSPQLLLDENLNGALRAQGKSSFEARVRSYITVDREPHLANNQAFETNIVGRRRSLVYDKDTRIWVLGDHFTDGWNGLEFDAPDGGAQLKITGGGPAENVYYPYRAISVSPNLLLAIVPADTVVEVTLAIHGRYLDEFGKVYGRLPIAIGNIVFQKFVPMFSVLDAARRMTGNFQRLQEGLWIEGQFPRAIVNNKGPLSISEGKPLQETKADGIDLSLGDGNPDYHHPYIPLSNDAVSKPATDLMTPAGRIVYMSEITEHPRPIRYRPNLYDGEMLGASADRFKLHIHEQRNRPLDWRNDPECQLNEKAADLNFAVHRGSPSSQWPITIEDFEKIVKLWDMLKKSPRATDASIRNLEHVIVARREAWRNVAASNAGKAIDGIARSIAAKFTGFEPESKEHESILDAISSGLFDRTLDIHLRILKDRLKSDAQQGEQP